MVIFKVIACAIVCGIICFYLKSIGSGLFIPALIVSGLILLSFSLQYLTSITHYILILTEKSKLDSNILNIVIKMLVVSYLIEFTVSLIEDFGFKSLSEKMLFAGKIILFAMSIPIFELLIETVTSFIN